MNILDQILATKREEVAARKVQRAFNDIHCEAQDAKRAALSFSAALRGAEVPIVAEFKRRSPSKGWIHREANVEAVVGGYSAHGAAAISVLTDELYFGGSLADLRAARTVATVPLLRKDFVIDPYQLCEARIAGADVVLLIAAALTVAQCADLAQFAHALGLEVLLEIHNEQELQHLNPHVNVVGINNRNLSSFVTDTAVSEHLAALVPNHLVKISESGISHPDTVKSLRTLGFQGFLMGENFMKTSDPVQALSAFIAAVRSER